MRAEVEVVMQVVLASALLGIRMVVFQVHHLPQDTMSPVRHLHNKQTRDGCQVKDGLSGQELHPEHSRVRECIVAHKYPQLRISHMAHRYLQLVISHMELNFLHRHVKVMELNHQQVLVSHSLPLTHLRHVVDQHLHYFLLPHLLLKGVKLQHPLPELKLLHGEKEVF